MYNKGINNNDRIEGYIYTTTNYDKFKILDGNREVTEKRACKIKASMEKYGIIFNPIQVNEKYEIIDGQGRFTALKQLGKPISYYVQEGAGVEQCIAINAGMTNWSMSDYINSYIKDGDQSYERLSKLCNSFTSLNTTDAIKYLRMVNTRFTIQGSILSMEHPSGWTNSNITQYVKEGGVCITEELYQKTFEYLTKAYSIVDVLIANNGRVGRRCTRVHAILWMLLRPECDYNSFISKVKEYGRDYSVNRTDIRGNIEELTALYNYRRSKKNCVYFNYLYEMNNK